MTNLFFIFEEYSILEHGNLLCFKFVLSTNVSGVITFLN